MLITRNSECGLNGNREEYYARMAAVGWQGIDVNETANGALFDLPQEQTDEKLKQLLETIYANGLKVDQCHAPMPRPVHEQTEEALEKSIVQMEKCVEACDRHNIAYTVVHPLLWSWSEPSPEVFWDKNIRYLKRLCSHAQKVKVCLENMPGPNGFINSPQTLAKMVEAVNDPRLAVCVDTGHAVSVNQKTSAFFALLGDLICVLHVHDSVPGADKHMLATSAAGDWNDFKNALKHYGYQGNMNSESDFVARMPLHLQDQASRLEIAVLASLAL